MRSIKLFFLVLAGLVVFSLMLRVLLPVLLFVGAIGLGFFLIRRIGRAIRREYHFQPSQGSPYLRDHGFQPEPLFRERGHRYEDIDEVQYVEVK